MKRQSSDPRRKEIRNLDDALSKLVRFVRDVYLPCVLCGRFKQEYHCGHFISRDEEVIRFHPMNVNKECSGCNESHVSGYRPDKGYPYSVAIDEKYGDGVSRFLYRLTRPLKEVGVIRQKDSFSVDEINFLKDAALSQSPRLYEQAYYSIRPHHKFDFSRG